MSNPGGFIKAVANLCTCKFVAVGVPMDARGCTIHTRATYACDYGTCSCYGTCGCKDYRPSKDINVVGKWPVCVCGHLTQDHNS